VAVNGGREGLREEEEALELSADGYLVVLDNAEGACAGAGAGGNDESSGMKSMELLLRASELVWK